MTTFDELQLSEPLSRSIQEMGFEQPTPIQAQTIPSALKGNDLIGQAQTGTGKTAAFGIPLITACSENRGPIQGLVVAPTRELAIQVAEELNKIAQYKGVHSLPIYGGQDIGRQIRALKKRPAIIVGTPGRLIDHIERRTIRLQHIKTVVLDEADEMLNMGFIEDIEKILEHTPSERQTLLFSATMPLPIQRLAEKFMQRPKVIRTKSKEVTVPNITQQYIEVRERQKFDALCRILDIHSPDLAIVFGRTKRRVDELSEALGKRGYSAEGIHGDLSQARREKVLRKFKAGTIEVLVATDVAARGLDVSGVSHVVNFDVPQDPESYVHRIGRTGRAGNTGLAITFITPRERGLLKTIETTTKRRLERRSLPNQSEAMEGQQQQWVAKLMDVIDKKEYQAHHQLAEDLLEEHSSTELLAAALKLLIKEPSKVEVKLTEEAPLVSKKAQYRGRWKPHRRNHRGFRNPRQGDPRRNKFRRRND